MAARVGDHRPRRAGGHEADAATAAGGRLGCGGTAGRDDRRGDAARSRTAAPDNPLRRRGGRAQERDGWAVRRPGDGLGMARRAGRRARQGGRAGDRTPIRADGQRAQARLNATGRIESARREREAEGPGDPPPLGGVVDDRARPVCAKRHGGSATTRGEQPRASPRCRPGRRERRGDSSNASTYTTSPA